SDLPVTLLWHPLARSDREGEPVLRGRQRTRPAVVVRTRRVVREIEVEHDVFAGDPQIGALDRVVEIAAAAARPPPLCPSPRPKTTPTPRRGSPRASTSRATRWCLPGRSGRARRECSA